MRKKHVIIYGGLIALACIGFWFFHPSPGYDITRVEPRLRALQEPYRHIKTAYYLDGGSIGIEITDRDGRTEQFAIPAHLGDPKPYAKVFVGAMFDGRPGAIEVSDSEQTKRMLVHILASMPHRTYRDDVDLMLLRRRPADYVRCFILKMAGADRP